MKTPSIHASAQGFRKHFLPEWLEVRRMEPMEFLAALNEDPELPAIDKSQVYRWIKGQTPQRVMLPRIARVLSILAIDTDEPDPYGIFRDPDLDWIARRLRGQDRDDVERIKAMIDLAVPLRKAS